jgi:hypothetical protein
VQLGDEWVQTCRLFHTDAYTDLNVGSNLAPFEFMRTALNHAIETCEDKLMHHSDVAGLQSDKNEKQKPRLQE